MEFAAIKPLGTLDQELIQQAAPRIAVNVLTTLNREQTEQLLARTQAQAEALQTREEALQRQVMQDAGALDGLLRGT